MRTAIKLVPLILLAVLASAQSSNVAALKRGFEHPPDDARIMMRWWWFGPAVTKPELEREMRLMKEAASAASKCSPSIRWRWTIRRGIRNCLLSPTNSSTRCASPAKRRASSACAWI